MNPSTTDQPCAPTPAAPTRPGHVPVDFEAILSAMQDQLDDLTAVVESLSRRLAERERSDRPKGR